MKKKHITIVAVISAALLLGGTALLVKDDVQQSRKNAEIQSYALTPDVKDKLDEITDKLTAETQAVSSESEPETAEIAESVPESHSGTEETPVPTEVTEITEVTEFIAETEISVQESSISDTIPAEILEQIGNAAQTLTAAYPDAIGWLYVPDTNINYPLMQGKDNEFYLHHAYDGSYLTAGSVFLDCRCEPKFMNPINVVYAHNMKNGSMFAGVINFKNAEYFNSHRYGWLATADKVYRIDFFSVAVADWHNAIYDGSQPISEWIPRIESLSAVYTSISYDESDRFISLSTCSSEFQNARTVLTGKLIEMKGD